MEQASSKPMLKPTEIVKDFKKYYGLDVSYYNAWYEKESAKKMMHGDESLSYNHLAWYVRAIESSNPSSHYVLECDAESSRFKRIFPMLFLDGIKNKYKGHLLDGIKNKYKGHFLDGNQGIYPLAFAVVNSENEENWSWFLQNLSKIVTPQGRTITFISDRQKGLIKAVASVFPQSPHAFCYHHLKQNILLKYPSSLGKSYRDWIIQLFGKCAYAPTEDAFEMHLRALMEEGGAMLDGIRAKIMEMNAQRRRVAEGWKTSLCPEMETIMQDLLECGRHWDVGRSSEFLFEVHGEDSVMVDLQSRTCSCRMWQIKGFPCAHALAAILKSEGNPYEYVEDYFMVHFFKSCYDIPIVPIPDIDRYAQEENEEMLINPPLTKKPPGRARVKRIKSSGERTRLACSRCGTLGHHNRKTCTAEI
ncbi:uncharacterized protein [Pyrus communis]|uniref:uncharacterized protein n=1 Tax=Pyrus communis TaxID=23211 RepID=UPI0035C14624